MCLKKMLDMLVESIASPSEWLELDFDDQLELLRLLTELETRRAVMCPLAKEDCTYTVGAYKEEDSGCNSPVG